MGRTGGSVRVAVGLMLALTACASISKTTTSTDKFEQTWPTSYAKTTCAQWFGEMNANQRLVAAADMLTNAQQYDQKGAGLPQDELITQFEGDISEACEPIKAQTIVDIATTLYLIAGDHYGP